MFYRMRGLLFAFGVLGGVLCGALGGTLGATLGAWSTPFFSAAAAEGELNLERLEESVPSLPEPQQPESQQPEPQQPDPSNPAFPLEPLTSPAEDVPLGRFADEVPEEILRTEIITEARSPLTGEPLTALEYAQLQAELASPAGGNLVNEDIRYLIFLLQLRRAVKPIVPFIP